VYQTERAQSVQTLGTKPVHPSLHFKCINHEEDIWSVRVTLDYRAVGVFDGNTVTWFWIGSHAEYERFFS
jgi:hypothetical protein